MMTTTLCASMIWLAFLTVRNGLRLAVVAVANMVGSGDEDSPPPWWFFDNPEQRAKYEAWLNAPPPDLKPRVVSLRRGPQKEE
jgi:hypothetical protein